MLNLTISTLTRKTPIWFAPAAWMFQFFGNLAGALLVRWHYRSDEERLKDMLV